MSETMITVLCAICASEYWDGNAIDDSSAGVWTFSVRARGLTANQINGTIGAASKAGFVWTCNGAGEDEAVGFLPAGVSALAEALGIPGADAEAVKAAAIARVGR